MIYCPECGSRISDKAITCPRCGFVATEALIPISSLPPVEIPPTLIIPEAAVFSDGGTLITPKVNRTLVEFLSDARTLHRLAPAIYDSIDKMMGQGDVKYVADFSKAAMELMEKGELVFSVEKKTGELLPQLRSVKTGRVYEKARIRREDVPADVMPSLSTLQTQVMIAEIMGRIESVAANVEALRLEAQADRIAAAESAWQQLQQAVRIRDARLRELKILDIAAKATDARCQLEGNFKTNLALAMGKQGRSKDWGQAANTAIVDLSVIALSARTEYAAYCLLDERDAANATLGQFQEFIRVNRLSNKDTLLLINSFSSANRESIVNDFHAVAKGISKMVTTDAKTTKLISATGQEGATNEVRIVSQRVTNRLQGSSV